MHGSDARELLAGSYYGSKPGNSFAKLESERRRGERDRLDASAWGSKRRPRLLSGTSQRSSLRRAERRARRSLGRLVDKWGSVGSSTSTLDQARRTGSVATNATLEIASAAGVAGSDARASLRQPGETVTETQTRREVAHQVRNDRDLFTAEASELAKRMFSGMK